jgi:hypothetical protein
VETTLNVIELLTAIAILMDLVLRVVTDPAAGKTLPRSAAKGPFGDDDRIIFAVWARDDGDDPWQSLLSGGGQADAPRGGDDSESHGQELEL